MKVKQLVLISMNPLYCDEHCVEQDIGNQNVYELIEKYAEDYCGCSFIEYIREWKDAKGNIIYDFGSPNEFFELREV